MICVEGVTWCPVKRKTVSQKFKLFYIDVIDIFYPQI